MKKLGLDLGSSSIGLAIMTDNELTKKAVVTFQSGMIKGKSGYTSPTKDRREARSKRRLIQARKYRKWELLKKLLEKFVPLSKEELEIWSKYRKGKVQQFPENVFFLKWLACDFTYCEDGIKYKNPYELRVIALDSKLSDHEFGRVLYHLIQRRGYKDIGETDTETEKQIKRRSESGFEEALKKNRTIAEALTNNFLNKGERARNQYPYRDEYCHELEEICKAQGYDVSKSDGAYNDTFIQKLWSAIIWQRPLRSQKGNIGKCTLEPTKQRCPISHPVFEVFRSWSFINTIKYFDDNGEKQQISQEAKNQLFEQLFLKKDQNFKFEEVRKSLDKFYKWKGNYNYPYNNKKGTYDSNIAGMPVCTGLIKLFGDKTKNAISTIEEFNIGNAPKIEQGYSIYDLWHILFDFDERNLEKFAKEKLIIENQKSKNGDEYNPLVKLKKAVIAGYSDLSIKAMAKIIPFLKEGYLYNEAVVLAKIPDLLGTTWNEKKDTVTDALKRSNKLYNWNSLIINITNNLIDKYKGLEYPNIFAYNDFQYALEESDIAEIEKTSIGYFGEISWQNRSDKETVLFDVAGEYQSFFFDRQRKYRQIPTLRNIFIDLLKSKDKSIDFKDNLYHHSKKENIYGTKIKDKRTGIEILPEPRIDSIKNPMFNKSMTILRKLVNELILDGTIDEETEVTVEIARELNDNNKRIAIERYQNERRLKRDKYREFLKEFKATENNSINVEDSIASFELWNEQIFEQTENEINEKVLNLNRNEILKEKEAIKRYELWIEQKGQCIYTGRMISITKLFSNEIDIEHTIPRSLLPDNTLANQTVSYARYNRDIKGTYLPYFLDNYDKEHQGFTAILPRLDNWIQIRDGYKDSFEKRLKSLPNEDEANKNKRVQEKHYYRMHYDYWHDKVERFLADEVKDSWARRQLVDTQMVSKYAREFLKTYFTKVAVQKGSVTADFRKIYGFQEVDEIKNRNKHTHHAIDATVLTLIPINSSQRDSLLKKMYLIYESESRQYTTAPFTGFNSQTLIHDIENNTLVFNYENDKISKQTYKNVRKRGKLQYLKNKKGDFVLDETNNKILLKAKGDTTRSTLFKQSFIGKIKDVERNEDGKPLRDIDGNWAYKKGADEFIFIERKPIKDVLSKIDDIVDPVIRELVRNQKGNEEIKDYQGNTIRHVRIKTKTGAQEVKERVNYKSKHEYKNYYYSTAGSLPYAILLEKSNKGKVEREMIPVASFEIAKIHKQFGSFNIEEYINKYHPEMTNYDGKMLLKAGQKVVVLNNDEEYSKKDSILFQTKRLYKIVQFTEGSIWLKYHLEAQSKNDIDDSVKIEKDKILRRYEIQNNIPEIVEDNTIENTKKRKDDFDKRKYSFDLLSRDRFQRLIDVVGIDETKEIKNELDKLKTQSSFIEVEGKTPLLKMSKENWNFLYEGHDFDISILGEIKWRSA